MWTPAGEAEIPRAQHTATLLTDGRVLVTGALGNKVETEIFDPATGTWSRGPDMSTPRYRHVAVQLTDGTVLIAGGNGKEKSEARAELFTP